jgi:protein SCO1/2
MAFADSYTRQEADYVMPDVTLVNQDGKKIKLKEYLDSDKPVIVDFVYATCTTICPVLSAGFSNFQKKSGIPTESVRLVSFTIDPENDTPEIMKGYLKRYGAKPGWDFLTGTRVDIDKVMNAFDAYVPDKMSHLPVSFFKGPKSQKWVRIYGLLGTAEMLKEYKAVTQ